MGKGTELGRVFSPNPKPIAVNVHPLSVAWPQAARLLPLAQYHRGEDSHSAEEEAAGSAGRGLAAMGGSGLLCHVCGQEVWFAPNPCFTERERAQAGTHTASESHSSSAGLGLVVTRVGGGEGRRCL